MTVRKNEKTVDIAVSACQCTIQMYSRYDLTHRQTEILTFLQEFRRNEGVAPTCREIADHFRFKSPKAVTDHLSALERKGVIRRRGGRARGIEVLNSETALAPEAVAVPIMGNIPAGFPEKNAEQRQGAIAVDPAILGGIVHHRLFALKVRGDSMEGRGIYEGDWVVADQDAIASEHDIVVALIDGESTLKTLEKQKEFFFLKAENPNYPDWIPVEELRIQGIVKAILRRIS